MSTAPDRLRELVDVVLDALDEDVDGKAIAARAYLSRFHFDRIVSSHLGEPPAALRRRLLLERAAWQLVRGETSVTEAGIDAGYGSTEAFSRAFHRAFGVAPSRFASREFRLDAPNGIHFHPPAGLRLATNERRTGMDLTDRLLEHDQWHTGKLIEAAAGLDDEVLDRVVRPGHRVQAWEQPEETIRSLLNALVFTKEVWIAAITGDGFPPEPDTTVDGLRRRHDAAGSEFAALARRMRDRNEWDDAFVDALCEPPQSFTFGGVVAHVLNSAAYRRQTLIWLLRDAGLDTLGEDDTINWEHDLSSRR